MAKVPLDHATVDACRAAAAAIADDVQRFIDRHTTVGLERTVARAYGVTGADPEGTPLANALVDRIHKAGHTGRGVAYFLGRALVEGASSAQEAAEQIAYGGASLDVEGGPTTNECRGALELETQKAIARIDEARHARTRFKSRFPEPELPLKYVIVATGNIYDDAVQAKAAKFAGADIVAVIRATAQSLLDYVPEGPTTEGYGGTYATQENFRIIRKAADEASEETGKYLAQTNYSSGLCMSEIAWMAAVERLDMLLNDAMYGILFRDINMERTFVDQYFSRRIVARSGIVINTGEDNYLTTADAVEKAHTVLASQFINEAFARRAGLSDEQMGLGHAFEIDPWLEDSFLFEVAQAQLIRQIFDKHPIKWMPPTKFKTGDVFHSHVHDAMFNLAGIMTHQSIELLGMFSEAIHTPLLMDRFLSLKSAKYIFGTARHLGDEIQWKPGGIVERRAKEVLHNAHELLAQVKGEGIWDAIGRGAFGDVKRKRTGGKGHAGVVARDPEYLNPILDELEGGR
ncbi:lysine 5,6-aminomutase subunit alpha [Polyangium jinanense]|uniref:lysine 5,6-aminomutase subunit alpha n=1 Tax=Polyangium jinanense TaxID=2829994 RepID=UPI00234012D5|nr:lysine 5,6-aminomutase subunit alpha [Polyangium jinanense]MDC3953962.1 lysine 5,6-aminomutase subunit alpha [Polyangium jinanense]MDC3957825.1 lysine 5,6-aminomutase subunit alpha [Polyangium jinanense]